jgi:multidrug transporter EmrE-like cation transporter
MISNATLFVLLGFVNYCIIALVGQLLSGTQATSAWLAFRGGFAPIPAILVIATNPIFGLALYYGFSVSRFAIPMILAIGACTSFVYSVAFLGATFTLTKLAGLMVICIGIALLAL